MVQANLTPVWLFESGPAGAIANVDPATGIVQSVEWWNGSPDYDATVNLVNDNGRRQAVTMRHGTPTHQLQPAPQQQNQRFSYTNFGTDTETRNFSFDGPNWVHI
jgi:hypothetical protein